MIDLYGQCVQISIYDEDYTESQETIPVPDEQRETETIPVIIEGAASMSASKFSLVTVVCSFIVGYENLVVDHLTVCMT